MIWYTEELDLKETPTESTATLLGNYNASPEIDQAAITIELRLSGPDGNRTIVLYEHSPTMLQHYEPQATEILERYRTKLQKARKKIISLSFHEAWNYDQS